MTLERETPFPDLLKQPFNPATEMQRYGEAPQQFLEGWPGERDVAIVMIHGGCWLNQFDLTHVRPFCSSLNNQGFPVWSLEYRRIGDPGGGWQGSFEDILAAIALIRKEYDEICLMGHSAGGHLALWAASQPEVSIKHCVGLAAISDLVTYAAGDSGCEKATLDLMGGTPGEVPERYAVASPLALEAQTPTTLIHGALDSIVAPLQSERYAREKNAAFVAVQDAGHFDVVSPRSIVWPVLLRALENSLG